MTAETGEKAENILAFAWQNETEPDAAAPIAIVFACDENYAPYLAVAVQSLADNAAADRHYEIIIMDCSAAAHSGALAESVAAIREDLAKRGNFAVKTLKVRAALADNAFLHKNEQALRRYGYGTYARILIPDLLADYEKILYLDIDHIILADVAKLFALPLGDRLIAAVPDINVAQTRLKRRSARKELAEIKLGLKNDEYYVIASPMLFNIKSCRAAGFTEHVLEFLSKQHDLTFPDQDAINFVCKGKIYYLPQKWGRVNGREYARICAKIERESAPETVRAVLGDWRADLNSPAIIHYVSAPKPWKGVEPEYSGLWWHYAAKTRNGINLLFALLFPFTAAHKQGGHSVTTYKILGLPLWTVKIFPQQKYCFLWKFPVICKKYGKENCYIYVLGMKLFSIRKKQFWE